MRGAAAHAEEHLGDRLAAFIDGELRDDQRERVQAHLVTCPQCKAEADEQRRLKSAVAGAIPPAVSASLLARLHGLPGGDGGDRPGGVSGLGGPGGPFGSDGPLPGGRRGRSYLTLGRGPGAAAQPGRAADGFRIHEAGRTAPRSRRFAFAAAGAFSLAALALGGALPLDAVLEGAGVGDPGPGASAGRLGAGAHSGAGRQGTASQSGEVLPGVAATPFAGVAPLSAARPLLSRPGGTTSPAEGLSPSPVDAISSAAPAVSVTPTAAPAPAPSTYTAAPLTPSPASLPDDGRAHRTPGR